MVYFGVVWCFSAVAVEMLYVAIAELGTNYSLVMAHITRQGAV